MAIFSILLSVTLAAIFKHGNRFFSKIMNFRQMSLTFDKKFTYQPAKGLKLFVLKFCIFWYALYKHLLC